MYHPAPSASVEFPLPRSGLVVLDGADDLTHVLAQLLGELGVRLEVGCVAADAVDLAVRAGDRDAVPDVVVLAGAGWGQPSRWATWRRLGIPHLPVEYDRRQVSVGPVVVPGSPCLNCLQLHRKETPRPAHGRQLGGASRNTDTADGVLTVLGAGVAALLTRNLLLHRRHLPGVSLEVILPDPRIVPRRWQLHPRCDGHNPPVTM